MGHDDLMYKWGNHPAVTERLNETAKYYAAMALDLEDEAGGVRGRERIDLLTAARGSAKLAALFDKQDGERQIAEMSRQLTERQDLAASADKLLQ